MVIDRAGTVLLSQRVEIDETALLELITSVLDLDEGEAVCWETDLNAGGAALVIASLVAHGQQLLYIPAR